MLRLLVLSDNLVDQKVMSTILQNAAGPKVDVRSRLISECDQGRVWGDLIFAPHLPAVVPEVAGLKSSFKPSVVVGLLNRRNHHEPPTLGEPFDGFLYTEQISVESVYPWILVAEQRVALKRPPPGELRILVAQSGASVPPIVSDLARRTGASITTMSDRPAFNLVSSTQRFSLVVVDTSLPDFRTLQALRELRSVGGPIVAIVGATASDEYRRALGETADRVIPAESDPGVIQQLIDTLDR